MEPKSKKTLVIVIIAVIIIGTAILSYKAYKKSVCGQPGQPAC
jgi:hypothetical protein